MIEAAIVTVVVALLALAEWVTRRRQRRWNMHYRWALTRGWQFNHLDPGSVASEFSFVTRHGNGNERRAFDVLWGRYNGREACAFHSVTWNESTDSEGNTSTSTKTRRWTVALRVEGQFNGIRVRPETRGSRLRNLVSGNDLDFDSSEFSRRFEVSVADRALGFDFCNPEMINFLLAGPDRHLELNGSWLVVTEDGQLDIDRVDAQLHFLDRVRALMPQHMFEQQQQRWTR